MSKRDLIKEKNSKSRKKSGDKSWIKKPKSFPHLLILTCAPWFKS